MRYLVKFAQCFGISCLVITALTLIVWLIIRASYFVVESVGANTEGSMPFVFSMFILIALFSLFVTVYDRK